MSPMDRAPRPAPSPQIWLRAVRTTSEYATHLAAGLTLGLMLLTVADVFMRYFLNRPIVGAFEISEYLFVAATLLGLACAEIGRNHLSVGFVVDLLGPHGRRAITLVNLAIAFTLSAVMAVYAFDSALDSFIRGETRQGYTVQIPVWPARAALPLGFGLLCMAQLANMLAEILPKIDGISTADPRR
jgi:TRAP-type C4-dicarboxylate transport system permease small subunit